MKKQVLQVLLVSLATLWVALLVSPVAAQEGGFDGHGAPSAEEPIGTVGTVSPPPPVPTPPAPPAPAPDEKPRVTERPTATSAPRYQTREGTEESARQVLGGKFALRHHSHTRCGLSGHKGLVMGIDRRGKVVSVGARKISLSTKGHRALWQELHRAGILGKREIEKRDRETLAQAANYTDQKVGEVAKKAWVGIILALVALCVGALTWFRHPHWRPVYY